MTYYICYLLHTNSLHIPQMLLQQKFPKQPQTGDTCIAVWISMQISVLAGKPVPHLILCSPALLRSQYLYQWQLRDTHISSAAPGYSPSTLPFHSPMKWGMCNSTQEKMGYALVWCTTEAGPACCHPPPVHTAGQTALLALLHHLSVKPGWALATCPWHQHGQSELTEPLPAMGSCGSAAAPMAACAIPHNRNSAAPGMPRAPAQA